MCGIAGSLDVEPRRARAAVEGMCEHMRPRGPDDGGVFEDAGRRVVLGNRRLAIIDPSSAGHQPMVDEARGTVVTFNGMIYNFRELRRELQQRGESFHSDCDTEVVLRAYGVFGPEFVQRLHGMFAIAIWDPRAGRLVLARDRMGIKPLYYAELPEGLAFASQVKTLLAGGLLPFRLSPEGLATYLRFGGVSDPLTIAAGIRAVPAGHLAVVEDGRAVRTEPYWSILDQAREAVEVERPAESLRELLRATVRSHLVSDTKLGVFLSGGLDSSLLAALAAQEQADVQTVSVSFDESSYAEGSYAELVARRIGSSHLKVTLRPAELVSWLPAAFDAMDQPTFDGINSYVVSRAASESGLKVALSGLGADELFDGYGYVRRTRFLRPLRLVPRPLGPVLGRVAARSSREGAEAKIRAWVGASGSASPYQLLRSVFLPSELLPSLRDADPRVAPLDTRGLDRFAAEAVLDVTNYTRNVLLRDTDAMSMSNSLEARVPFLDDAVVAWALGLPEREKRERKRLLIEAASDLLPDEVLGRSKKGFALPLSPWMKRDINDEIEHALLDPPELLRPYLQPERVTEIWRDFNADGRRWVRPWTLFALARWVDTVPAPTPTPTATG